MLAEAHHVPCIRKTHLVDLLHPHTLELRDGKILEVGQPQSLLAEVLQVLLLARGCIELNDQALVLGLLPRATLGPRRRVLPRQLLQAMTKLHFGPGLRGRLPHASVPRPCEVPRGRGPPCG